MGLDLSKLEKVVRRGSNTVARCPACAEAEGDHKGEHLFINGKGQFGCILYPGEQGKTHRQRIFALAGVKEIMSKSFEVRKPAATDPKAIKKDILGHLGHIHSTLARKNTEKCGNEDNPTKEFISVVPSVPKVTTSEGCYAANSIQEARTTYKSPDSMFDPCEYSLLKDALPETLDCLNKIKKVFPGSRVREVKSTE
ncbi:MAG TPA: hypothetical protein DEQ77_00605 [Candidatus Omnitrophica bacterium]|nr:hypothetical protein [Candidatus Omnitrophota bacterium]